MRYILQFIAMASDLTIIGACAFCVYFYWQNPIAWVAAGMGYCSWKKSGGFMAWNPRMARKFFRNAKKAGL